MSNTTLKNIFNLLLLGLLLVVFPVGSWFYLKKGADFRREKIAQLLDYGTLVVKTPIITLSGSSFHSDSLNGKMIFIANFSSPEKLSDEVIVEQINSLEEKFLDSPKFLMLLAGVNLEEELLKSLLVRSKKTILTNQSIHIEKIPVSESAFDWVLVDTKGLIRGVYTKDNFEDMLIQSTIVAPGKKRESIKLVRDIDK